MSDFKYDAFLSYAHLDDNPNSGVRWVTSFQDVLARFLQHRLGRAARIWRDIEQLSTLDDFENKIFEALRESATMVVVITPTFVKREWFTTEYKQFLATETRSVQDRTRIMMVYKTPISKDELPEYFQQFIGFDMWQTDINDVTCTLLATGETKQQFFKQVPTLAVEIGRLIAKLDGSLIP